MKAKGEVQLREQVSKEAAQKYHAYIQLKILLRERSAHYQRRDLVNQWMAVQIESVDYLNSEHRADKFLT